MNAEVKSTAARAFATRFGCDPDVVAYAPGRVNLLGEHTDYNGGLVLPMPLQLGTAVALGKGTTPGQVTMWSDTYDAAECRDIHDGANNVWSDYVLGALKAIATDAVARDGARVQVSNTLPVGSGLSSSAALQVGVLRAAATLWGVAMTPVETALTAQAVENDFIGLPCGIMDQYAVSVGTPGSAILLDTRQLASHEVPIPAGVAFVIVHSGVGHKLTDDGYTTRVAECSAACAALGVDTLSDLGPGDLPRVSALAAPLDGRARHVVTENARVRDAAQALVAADTARFGALMVESHASQRDDYAVSVPQVDDLVDRAMAAGAIGARLTGGGFGGSIVAMVAAGNVDHFCAAIDGAVPGARVLAVT